MVFKKLKIKSNFNKAAGSYAGLAILQKMVAGNLVKFIRKNISESEIIIDLGSGTGFIAENILSDPENKEKQIINLDIAEKMLLQNPENSIMNVNADIELLPFKSEVFDLVISSMAFQWLNNLKETISNIINCLKPKGVLAFSIVGSESLSELRMANAACGVNLSVNQFISKKELEEILSNFDGDFAIESEIIRSEYKNVFELLKSIKSIGAGYSFNKTGLNKNDFNKINNFYLKNFNCNNRVSCRWQIFYIKFQKNI